MFYCFDEKNVDLMNFLISSWVHHGVSGLHLGTTTLEDHEIN